MILPNKHKDKCSKGPEPGNYSVFSSKSKVENIKTNNFTVHLFHYVQTLLTFQVIREKYESDQNAHFFVL